MRDSTSISSVYSLQERSARGTPVRGNPRNTTLRYDLRPVLRPIQNGELVRELLEWFIGDVVDELGSRKEVEYAYRILEEGSSADRQLAAYKRTGDFKAVVDQLIAETAEGL